MKTTLSYVHSVLAGVPAGAPSVLIIDRAAERSVAPGLVADATEDGTPGELNPGSRKAGVVRVVLRGPTARKMGRGKA